MLINEAVEPIIIVIGKNKNSKKKNFSLFTKFI